jgi:hypothetical protein
LQTRNNNKKFYNFIEISTFDAIFTITTNPPSAPSINFNSFSKVLFPFFRLKRTQAVSRKAEASEFIFRYQSFKKDQIQVFQTKLGGDESVLWINREKWKPELFHFEGVKMTRHDATFTTKFVFEFFLFEKLSIQVQDTPLGKIASKT